MSRNRRTAVAAVLVLSVLGATPLLADEYHFIGTFVGDRAAGLAGAYTAIADGPEGMYYNPAGLAFAPNSYISVSTNALQRTTTTYADLAGTGVDWTRTSSAFIPNFFGFVQKGRSLTFGFMIASPDNEQVEQRDTLTFDLDVTDATQDKFVNTDVQAQKTLAGPTIAFHVGDRVSLGFGLLAAYRLRKQISTNLDDTFYLATRTGLSVTTSHRRSDTWGVEPRYGLQIMPSDSLSVGLAGSIFLPVYRTSTVTSTVLSAQLNTTTLAYELSGYQVIEPTTSMSTIFEDSLFATTFVRNTLGVAWFAGPRLVVSGDFATYIPVEVVGDDRDFTWNAAVGTEYYLGANFPLRVGFFTNRSSAPALEAEATNQPEHIDLYGGALSIGFATAESTLTVGGSVAYGTGQAQIISGRDDLQDATTWSLTLFVSGGYQF